MKITADMYYRVYKVFDGGQGFRDRYDLEATFDTKEEAENYIKNMQPKKEIYFTYRIQETIENIKKLT